MTFRHVCDTEGCYIKTQTPDWGFLDNSFSGRIRVGDIDGIVEANGHLLILEWKRTSAELTRGQEIMFVRCTAINDITVFLVHGCPKDTIVNNLIIYANGMITLETAATNGMLQEYCRLWEREVRSR